MAKEKLKVLIVDDAVLSRKVVSDVVSEEGDMEVFGTASNGRLALQRLAAGLPDVIILDFEMPEMNGLETIDGIRKLSKDIPIVMFSALTEGGARETLDALARGANDYVTKPAGQGGLLDAKRQIRNDLLPKIRALTGHTTAEETQSPGSVEPRANEPLPNVDIHALAIGVSTGGPNALSSVIPRLPADLPVPVLVTQHMPPTFTRMLAERLGQQSQVKVKEGQEGDVLKPGHVYIAPGGHHMTVVRKGVEVCLSLTDDPPENSCRPAVDVMLRSMVNIFDKHLLTIILTGMGQDGLIGCQKVRAAGGIVFAQDSATSVVWGMPGAVTKAGLAHRVLPLDVIAHAVENSVRRPASSPRGGASAWR